MNYNEPKPLEEALGVNFTIEMEVYGEKIEIELKEGGKNIMVNMQNKEEYVELYIEYIFNK